jgi:hypothetical protein
MNLNMIHSFFSNEKKFGAIEPLFSNLAVWGDKKAVGHAGKVSCGPHQPGVDKRRDMGSNA